MGTDHFMGMKWKVESMQKWDYEHRILKYLSQARKVTHAIDHVDFPDSNIYRKTILSDGKFQLAPTFLQNSFLR